ncbi:hypothetical protein [Vagococcus acidifermentans]|uniref:Zn-finger containing protein n=1 Tax=Vagococcus acidifermentans TaxID=564710 RepID=A0A430AXV0_9ENTE|nr:hypothetical protein [Vagococcus acidifermentans]RSU12900.1 hypothetical protein CBF27_05000 [Vagococcus acidifermentans]
MFDKRSKWQQKAMHAMAGRYGLTDTLNKHLLVAGVVLMLVNIVFASRVLSLLSTILIAYAAFRFLSKNRYKRVRENQIYYAWHMKRQRFWQFQQKRWRERKSYKYFSCSNCHQKLRVPRHKGRIKITCPKCRTQITKKT